MNTLVPLPRINMKRLMMAVALTALLVNSAHAAELKSDIVVTGDTVTVGDLFTDAGTHASYVLAPAPAPGKTLTLSASDLMRVSDAFNLGWMPAGTAVQARIKSAVQVVGHDAMSDALQAAIARKMGSAAFEMDVSAATPLRLRADQSEDVVVDALNIDQAHGTFTARLRAGDKSRDVAGRIYTLAHVPVLKSALSAGEEISAADIEMVTLRQALLPADVILDKRQIVGLVPRRIMQAGKPVQPNDLEPPMLVGKGQNVILTLENGGMVLTATGKALQKGVAGDVIRVMNTASNHVVEGVVTAAGKVTVRPAGMTIASN